ncbi:MAG: hypothetical protein J0L79_05715 [Rickettsiales bacterium]|nr:hypothetical protein [Rickettsiales bacterium]
MHKLWCGFEMLVEFCGINFKRKFINIVSATILVCYCQLAVAKNISANGFYISDKKLEFTNTIRSSTCVGSISYPFLVSDDEELAAKINDEIHDFAEFHTLCNTKDSSDLSISYKVLNTGRKDVMSIVWTTKKGKSVWRVDSLNFNALTGKILDSEDIFNQYSDDIRAELSDISGGRYSKHCSCENLFDKIEKRDVQLYLKNNNWFIVFNSTAKANGIVEVKLPENFIRKRDMLDEE